MKTINYISITQYVHGKWNKLANAQMAREKSEYEKAITNEIVAKEKGEIKEEAV